MAIIKMEMRLPLATAVQCNLYPYVDLQMVLRFAVIIPTSKQPTEGKDLIGTFICNCYDYRKITASMFALNFIVNDSALKHIRGEEELTKFARNMTIATSNTMANYFDVYGTLITESPPVSKGRASCALEPLMTLICMRRS